MTDREQLAWLAGLFNGEGSISPDRRQNRKVIFSIAQKDPSRYLLLKSKKILVSCLSIPEEKIQINALGKRADCWQLRIAAYFEVEKAILGLWEWLSPMKKAQAQETFYVYCEDFKPSDSRGYDVFSEICDLSIHDTFNVGDL